MRQFPTKASYYTCIVESAEKALTLDPTDTLHRQVTANVSGGHFFWDTGADTIYETPSDLEEALLALELRCVLEAAIKNQLAVVQQQALSKPVKMNLFGLPMDFGLLLGSAVKIAKRDARLALKLKIAMADIAQSATNQSLADFIGYHCLSDHCYGEEYCAMI